MYIAEQSIDTLKHHQLLEVLMKNFQPSSLNCYQLFFFKTVITSVMRKTAVLKLQNNEQ